jgi:hypothetical protein
MGFCTHPFFMVNLLSSREEARTKISSCMKEGQAIGSKLIGTEQELEVAWAERST